MNTPPFEVINKAVGVGVMESTVPGDILTDIAMYTTNHRPRGLRFRLPNDSGPKIVPYSSRFF